MIGDIICVKTNSLIGQQIRKYTKGDINHVGIFISDNEIVEAVFSGVKLTNIEYYKKLSNENKLTYKIGHVINSTKKQRLSVASYAYSLIGCKYDFIQFLSIFFLLFFNLRKYIKALDQKSAFICSELVAEAYETVGIKFKKNISNSSITPADIADSSKLCFNPNEW